VAWVYLDDQFPDHPKVALAGGDAGWLFICALAYVKRYDTEGVIPKAQVPRLSDRKAPTKLARRLVEVGLWEEDGDTYRIHDYHEWNRPGENRKAAARKAAQARWRNSQGNAKRNAKRNASASETHSESDSDPPAERTADASETHSDRIRDAHASTCPLPLPLTEDLTSSNGLTTRPDTPDDDDPATAPPNGHNPQPHQPNHAPDQDQRVGAALAVLADRDLAARQTTPHLQPVADPVSWRNGAYDRRHERHHADLERLANEHPHATPHQLADLLEPPTPASNGRRATGPEPVRITPDGAPFMPGTGPMTGPPKLPDPPADPTRIAAITHDIRQRLRQPHRQPQPDPGAQP